MYNCDSARNRGYSKRLGIQSNNIVKLDSLKQIDIIDYIHYLIDSKVSEFPIHSHATNYYSAILSDSSLIIKVGDNSKIALTTYKKLISELF